MDWAMLRAFIIPLAVRTFLVRADPIPGVTMETRTLSCCGNVYIPLIKGCLNTFQTGDKPRAIVTDDFSVVKPFQLQMEVKECMDFTHIITCNVGESHIRQRFIDYIMTPCSEDDASGAAALPQVGDLLVRANPTPGVTMETRTLSCCGNVSISLIKGCLNTFQIRDKPRAIVTDDFSVVEPFQLQMGVKKCMDFTHIINCNVGKSQTSERFIDYIMTPCSKDNARGAAAVPQGSLVSVLRA